MSSHPPPSSYDEVYENGKPNQLASKDGYKGVHAPPDVELREGIMQSENAMNPSFPADSNSDDAPEGFTVRRSFMDKDVRRLFVRKVFITLGIQLMVTFAFVCVFSFQDGVRKFVQVTPELFHSAYIVFLVVYIMLICCKNVRRKHPFNIIFLMIFTLAFSYLIGTIASFYDTFSVVIALGATLVVCSGVVIFSMQTKYDFTMMGGLLLSLIIVLFTFGLLTVFFWSKIWYMQVVWGALGALVFSMFLAYDTQIIMGGKKHELDPEEYIYASLHLYLDVCYVFLYILKIMRGGR